MVSGQDRVLVPGQRPTVTSRYLPRCGGVAHAVSARFEPSASLAQCSASPARVLPSRCTVMVSRRGRSMQRDIFTSDHEAFRDAVRSFIAKEIAPYHDQWELDGAASRDVWLAAGEAGPLGIDVEEQYGGGGN